MVRAAQILSFLIFAQESLGVGVGLGAIQVNQTLIPGGVYRLPNLPIVNTGQMPAEFQASVSLPTEYLERLPSLERKRREVLGAFRQRASTLWHFYQPWSTILIVGTDLIAVALLARTLPSVSIQIKPERNQ